MTFQIRVSSIESDVEMGFHTIKFYFDKEKDEFEVRYHSFKCPEENESCVYCTGSEYKNRGDSVVGYVEFYFKIDSHSRDNAIKEAMNKYDKFIAVWNIMGSVEAAGKAFGGRSKKEVDEENFKIQLDWHNSVFQ